jgi:hypothetical protein
VRVYKIHKQMAEWGVKGQPKREIAVMGKTEEEEERKGG